MMDGFWKTQSSIQDGCDPNISDSYLIVIGKAEPLSSAKLGKTSCENGLFFTAVQSPDTRKNENKKWNRTFLLLNNGCIWAVQHKTSLEELRRKFFLPVCPSLDTFFHRAHKHCSKKIIYLSNSHSVDMKGKTEWEENTSGWYLHCPLFYPAEIIQHALLDPPLLLQPKSFFVSSRLIRMSGRGEDDFPQQQNLRSREITALT